MSDPQMQQFEQLIHTLKEAREAVAQGQRDGLPPDEMLARREMHTERGKQPRHTDVRRGVRPTG
jgi:hypothetical protein